MCAMNQIVTAVDFRSDATQVAVQHDVVDLSSEIESRKKAELYAELGIFDLDME